MKWRWGLGLLGVGLAAAVGAWRVHSLPPVDPVVVNGQPMLLGEIAYADILNTFPDWRAADAATTADAEVAARFLAIRKPVDVLVFVGTWCSDSRAGVPAFMKTVEAAANPKIQVRFFGVDGDKHDLFGLAKKLSIRRVPTFVVLRHGHELGRLVERPETTFPQDFLRLLKGETVQAPIDGPGCTPESAAAR